MKNDSNKNFNLNKKLSGEYKYNKITLENKIKIAETNYNNLLSKYNKNTSKDVKFMSKLNKADSILSKLNDRWRENEKMSNKGIYFGDHMFENLDKAVSKYNQNYIEKNKNKWKN